MKKSYIVTLDLPEGCSIRFGEEYLRSAAQMWCKQFNPQESEFDIGDNATVKPIKDSRLHQGLIPIRQGT